MVRLTFREFLFVRNFSKASRCSSARLVGILYLDFQGSCFPFPHPYDPMQSVRDRAHNLINVMSDEDVAVLWATMQTQFYDLYLLGAVQSAKENFQPGDVLTREDALALVMSSIPTTNLIP